MISILDLPFDILTEILIQCDHTQAITETCNSFASTAFSTPSLWTSVRLCPRQFTIDGPDFLRTRISRARGSLLRVSIGLVKEETERISALCRLLAEHNTQIRRFELNAWTAVMAGGIVHNVFPKVEEMPELKVLSVQVEREAITPCRDVYWPRLDLVLVEMASIFPNLKKLNICSFFDCIPMLPLSTSFSHLTTLILNGALEEDTPSPSLIASLLHCTPQLESLWMKHHFLESFEDLSQPTAWGTAKGRSKISLDIQLPRLKHLAVSVPGTACGLMGCITAPALQDLHLDGSRGPFCDDTVRPEADWSHWVTELVRRELKRFASRCQSVRRLAVTEAYLTNIGWEWMLFGEEGTGPPFPKLESIALHGIYDHADGTWSGFDDDLLGRFAREPSIPLKRLVLLYCDFRLSASVLVNALGASGAKELEYDDYVPQWEPGEQEKLKELGVSMKCWDESELVEDLWWTYRHSVDASDSKAY